MNDITFISLGGWCGTKLALAANNYSSASNPFDYVRSSILGVIDCFETDFSNYFPKDNKKEANGFFLSKCCEFQHEDITSEKSILSFNRKIKRFRELLKQNKQVCFLRTICLNDYDNELKYSKDLQKAIEKSYPTLNYIVCFIITRQNNLSYYKNLDNKTFIFTINNTYVHTSHDYLIETYRYVFNFIKDNNLFDSIPNSNNNIELIKSNIELETISLIHT
jgi:hypothetical protein